MSHLLTGRTALITGGSRGIGEAIATAMAAAGAKVVIASRKQSGLDAAAERIRAAVPGAEVLPIAAHLGDPAGLPALVGTAEAGLGTIDILVNNAATNPYFGPMLDLEPAAWAKTFQVNLQGPFELSRIVARRLIDAGLPGSILNISSVYGLRGAEHQGIYGMTKAAMLSLTRTMALELGPQGIRVNAIAPGIIRTRFASALIDNPELIGPYNARTALKRPGEPDEVAGMAVFLASDAASYVTGQTMVVDGGFTVS